MKVYNYIISYDKKHKDEIIEQIKQLGYEPVVYGHIPYIGIKSKEDIADLLSSIEHITDVREGIEKKIIEKFK